LRLGDVIGVWMTVRYRFSRLGIGVGCSVSWWSKAWFLRL
jgi:hypothetical protein